MSDSPPRRALAWCYAATIFLSAFLLFQVQPLISKYILPWFGGTPAVWTTCMLFFQVLLFAGYAYAHFLSDRFSPKTQAIVHCAVLLLAGLMLPVTPSAEWKPESVAAPTFQILFLLACTVGLPFFALSATGPLLQSWFSRTHEGKSPYRLYALSNAGSLLALLSYPFVFEPALSSPVQAGTWSIAFVLFSMACAGCAIAMGRVSKPVLKVVSREENAPQRWHYFAWIGLAMGASVMLLATTNQVCMDVASVPFLWVVPLSLYLISFILTFESKRWYSRKGFGLATAIGMSAVCYVMFAGVGIGLATQAIVYFAGLFLCAMVCHGELVRLEPPTKYLTTFYLCVAAGGAAGGLFVGMVAPMIFSGYWEMHLAVWGGFSFALLVTFRELRKRFQSPAWAMVWLVVLFGTIRVGSMLTTHATAAIERTLDSSRNFYGVLRIERRGPTDDGEDRQTRLRHPAIVMTHGRIMHGLQFVDHPRRPTAYYTENSGVGRVLRGFPNNKPIKVGGVGLGVGTLATYARKGDSYRFYEINPDVLRLAEKHFSFMEDARKRGVEVEVPLGDARLVLEREEPQQFDVLVLDAFSGDAIPTHLLTAEAMQVYRRHLKPGGVLAIHVSNHFLDLRPVTRGLANEAEMHAVYVEGKGDKPEGIWRSQWMLLSKSKSALPTPQSGIPETRDPVLWTDERNNLFELLK